MVTDNLFNYDFYALRIPTFSFNKLTTLNSILEKVQREKDPLDFDISELQNIFSDDLFLEGLFFGSPVLFKELKKWLDGKEYSHDSRLRLILALHRYYSRMCSRCTPFGTFAAISTGLITDGSTEIQFQEDKFRKVVDFDLGFLSEIAEKIIKTPKFQRAVKFRANDTIYKVGDKYIYTESSTVNGNTENTLSSITESSYVSRVLSVSKSLIGFDDLVEVVRSENPSLNIPRIEQFIEDLIDSQVLISELNPQVTGIGLEKKLIEVISVFKDESRRSSVLEEVRHNLNRGNLSTEELIQFDTALKDNFLTQKSKETLQETLFFKTHKNTIKADVIHEISSYSKILWETLTPLNTNDLDNFKRRFENRFEGEELPLLEVLDTEIGIGYGLAVSGTTEYMPLLKNISVKSDDNEESIIASVYSSVVHRVLKTFYKTGNNIIEITEEEITELQKAQKEKKDFSNQNSSKFIFGSIIASSTNELDQGNFKFLAKQLFNYSAGRMLVRFANGDQLLNDKITQLVREEETINDKFVLAEILHNPGGHASNVVIRPSLFKYEIPINCAPSVNKDYVILLEDVMVSVRNDRVILRSKKLNKEILPQITNAFNTRRGEPMLRFLSDVQSQQMRRFFSWDWISHYDEEHLPRVEYKKIILTRARWKIKRNDNHLFSSIESFKIYIKNVCDRLNIPRYVTLLQDFDNELCLDLHADFCLRHLQRHLKRGDAILFEFLQTEDNCFIKSNDGSHCSEIIIPYGTTQAAYLSPFYHSSNNNRGDIKSTFTPGSEWLFFKIYGGNKMLDSLLKDILPFCNNLTAKGYIDKWFFIRYDDPERHLRLRFHTLNPVKSFSIILQELNKLIGAYLADNIIRKIVMDTYVREVERYTELFIEQSENLFFVDSIAVCNFLDKIDGDDGEEHRWMGALYSVDLLLSDFGFSIQEKKKIMEELSATFFYEFITSKSDAKLLNYSLNRKYRDKNHLIRDLLTGNISDETRDVFSSFLNRSRDIKLIIEEIITNPSATYEVRIRLVKSYIHMNLNRIFLSRSRNHEMVIYHLLKKFYTTANKIQNQLV